jgi:hypothetical protein
LGNPHLLTAAPIPNTPRTKNQDGFENPLSAILAGASWKKSQLTKSNSATTYSSKMLDIQSVTPAAKVAKKMTPRLSNGAVGAICHSSATIPAATSNARYFVVLLLRVGAHRNRDFESS